LIIQSTAPMRIADNGGWTDTWFARRGKVLSIAVTPAVHVRLETMRREDADTPVWFRLSDPDVEYGYEPRSGRPGRNPLLEAAIDEMGIPAGAACRIEIRSAVPPGASTGTSSSVTVALLGALARWHGGAPSPMRLAMAAHCVETERLGLQCGVQDQLAAAFGGVNFISIDNFPAATVARLPLRPAVERQLDERLLLIFLGASHRSDDVHRLVIKELEGEGETSPRLDTLRRCATEARDALLSGDLRAFGAALSRNTEAQARLHPALVGQAAQRVIDAAAAHGALGWKVNGAGGDGGSVTILRGEDDGLVDAIAAAVPASRSIPIALSPHGARVEVIGVMRP